MDGTVTKLWPFHAGQVAFKLQFRQTDAEEFGKGDCAAESDMIQEEVLKMW